MAYKIDDWVVHPQHGVGQVVKLELRQFGSGDEQLYYEVSIPDGSYWAKVIGASGGLRKLISKKELAKYRDILKSEPAPLTTNHRQCQIDLADRLRQGSFQAKCEVVRDVTALGWHKPLGESNAAILRLAHQALNQEWATAEGISLSEATREIDLLLQEGKQKYMEKSL